MIEELYCIDLFSKAKHKIKLKFFSGLKIITDITGMLNFHNIFLRSQVLGSDHCPITLLLNRPN